MPVQRGTRFAPRGETGTASPSLRVEPGPRVGEHFVTVEPTDPSDQGAFRSGDYEEIMNKVTALSVLSNAVLVWNTVRINEIVHSLEKSYGRVVLPEHLARLSPVAHGHVIPSGTYHFERASADRPVIERGPVEGRRVLA
jgi:hypothetical protein